MIFSASNENPKIEVRAAVPEDVPFLHDLIQSFAKEHLLLPRTKEDLLLRIGNFQVLLVDDQPAGCVALRDYGNDLYEVRSLAVDRRFQNRGFASILVQKQLERLRNTGRPVRVFSLTYRDRFFQRLGFEIVGKDLFPEKIWSDCVNCSHRDNCDEIAVLMSLPGSGQ